MRASRTLMWHTKPVARRATGAHVPAGAVGAASLMRIPFRAQLDRSRLASIARSPGGSWESSVVEERHRDWAPHLADRVAPRDAQRLPVHAYLRRGLGASLTAVGAGRRFRLELLER